MNFVRSDSARVPGGGRRKRHRPLTRVVATLLPAVFLLGACGSDDDEDSATTETTAAPASTDAPASSAASSTEAPATTEASATTDAPAGSTATTDSPATTDAAPAGPAPADEIGITDTEIRLAVMADVATPVNPGLFQKTVDVMNAWAEIVNERGGIAGRKVVLDVTDTKLNPDEAKNAAINACSDDFAMVGTSALLLVDVSDVETCADKTGTATGVPNIAGISFGPQQTCSALTFVSGSVAGTFCATKDDPEQTYTAQIGDGHYFTEQFPDLHGIWIYNSDVPTARQTQVSTYLAQATLGIGADGDQFYATSGQSPQSALTPIVQVIKREGSNFVQSGSTPPNLVLTRKEAELQGVDTVDVWSCASGCYNDYYIPQGGSSVEGTYQMLLTLPFYDEYQDNEALAALVEKLDGDPLNIDSNAMGAYLAALLFEDAVNSVVESGETLTRAALIAALNNTHDFDAGGIMGVADVGNRKGSPCMAMVQVVDGAWKRVHPAEPYTFDCDADNLLEYTADLTD